MTEYTGYKCNGCGQPKGETNHWYLAKNVWRGGKLRILASRWMDSEPDIDDWEHYCGQECWMKRILGDGK